jgi:energy-coupling factor transport system substrate-specific component
MNMKSGLPRTKKITYTAILIALAVSLRLVKVALFGPVQFVNFPGIFTIVGGILFGPSVGIAVGFASYLFSDIMIGLPGPWTVVNAVLMASFGLISGLIWGRNGYRKVTKIGLGIGTFVMMLAFDIISSGILLVMVLGGNWLYAFTIGLIGLFVPSPVSGGFMIGVGPITEVTTTILVVTIVNILIRNRGVTVKQG